MWKLCFLDFFLSIYKISQKIWKLVNKLKKLSSEKFCNIIVVNLSSFVPSRWVGGISGYIILKRIFLPKKMDFCLLLIKYIIYINPLILLERTKLNGTYIPDQINMAVLFWYLVKSVFNMFATALWQYSSVHWTSHVLQGNRNTRPCITGHSVLLGRFTIQRYAIIIE